MLARVAIMVAIEATDVPMVIFSAMVILLISFSGKDDTTISANGIATLANSYAADGQLDKAVDTYKKAAKHAGNAALSPLFLMQAAQILESQNKKEEPHSIYLFIYMYFQKRYENRHTHPDCKYCVKRCYSGSVICDLIHIMFIYFYRLGKEISVSIRISGEKIHNNIHLLTIRSIL